MDSSVDVSRLMECIWQHARSVLQNCRINDNTRFQCRVESSYIGAQARD